jgi:octaprenyl-diphosphate synthase
MSEGELLQLEKARLLNIRESDYFTIIRNKTASLLASACAAGAYSAQQDLEMTEKMRQFGEYTGIAFQIKDDLFDYGNEDVGKPTGNDIREKKLTLPLIFTLDNTDRSTRSALTYIIRNKHKSKEDIQTVIETVKATGGIEYARDSMESYKSKAMSLLVSMRDCKERQALEDLVRYTTERRK